VRTQALFRRGQLKALVDIHSETDGLGGGYLTSEEINIIRGALDMTEKKAFVGMTPLDKVIPHLPHQNVHQRVWLLLCLAMAAPCT
jgi:hypothetical protein